MNNEILARLLLGAPMLNQSHPMPAYSWSPQAPPSPQTSPQILAALMSNPPAHQLATPFAPDGNPGTPTDGPMLDEMDAFREAYRGKGVPFNPNAFRQGDDSVPDFNGFRGEPGRHGLYWLRRI